MATVQHDIPPGTVDSAAVRGLLNLPSEAQGAFLLRLLASLDRGDERDVRLLLRVFRDCEHGIPRSDPAAAIAYTWEEWQAEFGSGDGPG